MIIKLAFCPEEFPIVDETVLLSVIIYSFNKYFKSIEWENSELILYAIPNPK